MTLNNGNSLNILRLEFECCFLCWKAQSQFMVWNIKKLSLNSRTFVSKSSATNYWLLSRKNYSQIMDFRVKNRCLNSRAFMLKMSVTSNWLVSKAHSQIFNFSIDNFSHKSLNFCWKFQSKPGLPTLPKKPSRENFSGWQQTNPSTQNKSCTFLFFAVKIK